jgi:acyl-CoA dehydrogenase
MLLSIAQQPSRVKDMDFSPSPRAADLTERVRAFMSQEIEPAEPQYHRDLAAVRESGGDPWQPLPLVKELQEKARAQGLWNLFLPAEHAGEYAARFDVAGGEGLSNVDYAPIAELTGRSFIAPHVFNCNAPDTGNMEVLLRYGTDAQRKEWLEPLLDGRIRSAFTMTEPGVASSDATNMQATAVVDGDEVVVNGRKWWSTGVGHPDCKILIFMGLTDPDAPRHARHSMVLVPRDTPGVKVERMLSTMGIHDEPHGHGEVSFTDVRVPASNILVGPGRAFEIAQGRLGPGRVHHCMRLVGLAEKALELACRRATERVAFGKPLANLGGNRERIADARIAIDQARLLVLKTAWLLDTGGPAAALSEVSQIKVAVPAMAQQVIDMAIQLHGGGGMSDDFPLAAAWTNARSLRLADGPDEVHRGVVAKLELAKYPTPPHETARSAHAPAGTPG